MPDQSFTYQQTVFKDEPSSIHVVVHHANSLSNRAVRDFTATVQNGFVGVAPAYGSHCALFALAFASATHVLIVNFPTKQRRQTHRRPTISPAVSDILSNPRLTRYSLHADRVATALHLDMELHIGDLIDLGSLNTDEHASDHSFVKAICGEWDIDYNIPKSAYKDEKQETGSPWRVALRAWISCRIASRTNRGTLTGLCPRVDVGSFNPQVLKALSRLCRDADLLDALKPNFTANDVKRTVVQNGGAFHVTSKRYKSRIRRDTQLRLTFSGADGNSQRNAYTKHVKGKGAALLVPEGIATGSKLRSAVTIGKDPLTLAETERQDIVRGAFFGKISLCELPFFRAIWFPETVWSWKTAPKLHPLPILAVRASFRELNSSQESAVQVILSSGARDRVCLVQGPPGTGKTTVIAESVQRIRAGDSRRTIYLVAQSNVAVKNIAEKLAVVGFLDFRLLISHEFHFDWHEHLYEKIGPKIIVSDKFPKTTSGAESKLEGAKVILCTLSMLLNPKCSVFTTVVPVETVIVDEASQIEIGNYVPLVHLFKTTVSKLVFIGDDKQLPPYGQENIPGLQSVFEISRLRSKAKLLAVQYRMPRVVGAFISRHVYAGQLKTEHPIASANACRFIDVPKGKEEKYGHSWVNKEECHIAVRIAQRYDGEGKTFRIITPYDAQRNLIETSLRRAGIPYGDRVFNVDAFQDTHYLRLHRSMPCRALISLPSGNESDHIIISLVRTEKLGFLRDLRRSNVMLSRCKQSMAICSNRAFLEGPGSTSLAGKLAKECGHRAWLSVQDVWMGRF